MPSRSSALGYALLGLIRQAPQSGYALMKIFKTTPLAPYSGSPGAVYPALRALTADGWIRGTVDRSRALRPKQVYRITRRGRAALAAWLRGPVTRSDVAAGEEELMLRFVLMEGVATRAEIRRFLESLRRELALYTATLSELRGFLDPSSHARVALDGGIDVYRARLRWVGRVLAGSGYRARRSRRPGRAVTKARAGVA